MKVHFSVKHHNLKSQTLFSKRNNILSLAQVLVNNNLKVGGHI